MTTINPNIASSAFATTGATGTGGVDAAKLQAGLTGLASTTADQLMRELSDLVATLASTRTSATGTGDAVSDARGAPALAAPETTYSQEDMVELLRSIRSKSQDGQLQAAKSGIETARLKAEKNTESQLKKIEEWVKKCEEANKKSTLGKIFSWIGKIAAVIASVVAVAVAAVAAVGSFGAGAPLLALAVMGLVGSTISLADQISQECGGPNISIGNLITTMTSKFLEACGVDSETAGKIGKVMAGVAAAALPAMLLIEPGLASTFATGICELAGASSKVTGAVAMAVGITAAVTVGIVMAVASFGASSGSAVVNAAAQTGSTAATAATTVATTAAQATSTVTTATVSTAAKVANGLVGAGAQIASGATQIGTGIVTIQKAGIEKDGQKALADKKELAADMLKLQQQMEDGREEIKKVIQQIEEGLMAVTQMINGAADSMSQITANMGKRMAV
jgi:hypothetical protein